MIIKELDAFVDGDTLALAGRKAEENLAHYLNRAFKDSPDFLVFNGLRLQKDDDAAQMDHLILHRYGVIIVESKSVSSRVRINEHEEWARFWNGGWRGMPSPIKQAERQGKFLQDILQEHRAQLRNKVLFGLRQGGFLTMSIDVLVAISDSGLIDRPRGKNALPQVCKADQVTDKIYEIHARYKKAPSYELSKNEIDRISAFLLHRNSPLCRESCAKKIKEAKSEYRPVPALTTSPPEKAAISPVSVTLGNNRHSAALRCRHCSADKIDIVYGRYGYYFKCLTCAGNTPLNRLCRHCGGKEKTRKDDRKFFAECAACATSYAFHENANSGQI